MYPEDNDDESSSNQYRPGGSLPQEGVPPPPPEKSPKETLEERVSGSGSSSEIISDQPLQALPGYRSLPSQRLKKRAEKIHHDAYNAAYESAAEYSFKHTMTPETLLKNTLTPGEEVVPIQPLHADRYYNEETITEKRDKWWKGCDRIRGAQLWITSDRMVMIDTTKNEESYIKYPFKYDSQRHLHEDKTTVFTAGHQIFDTVAYEGIPLKQITNVKINLGYHVFHKGRLRKITPIPFIAAIIGLCFLMVYTSLDLIYYYIAGIVLVCVAWYVMLYQLGTMTMDSNQASILTIHRVDPYSPKKGLRIRVAVDTRRTTIGQVVSWINVLQDRCPRITNPDEGITYQVNL